MKFTHRGYQVVSSLSACLALSITFVILRFAARLRRRRAPLLADYVALVALATFIAYAGVLYKMVDNPDGSLEPIELKHMSSALLVFHDAIVTETLLAGTITLVKLSILLFYREIFISKTFRRLNTITIGICLVWFWTIFFVLIFQCNPIAAGWNYALVVEGAKCLSFPNVIMGMEITNICVDVLIMAIPCIEIRKLQMRRSRKIAVSLVLMLGGLVAVASAIRIHYTRSHERLGPLKLVNFTQTYVWTNIQLSSAIICACLPTLPPLLPDTFYEDVSSVGSKFKAFLSSRRGSSRVTDSEGGFDEKSHSNTSKAATDSIQSADI